MFEGETQLSDLDKCINNNHYKAEFIAGADKLNPPLKYPELVKLGLMKNDSHFPNAKNVWRKGAIYSLFRDNNKLKEYIAPYSSHEDYDKYAVDLCIKIRTSKYSFMSTTKKEVSEALKCLP